MSNSKKWCYIVGVPHNSDQEVVIGDGSPDEELVQAFDRILGEGDEWKELFKTVRIVHGIKYATTMPERNKYLMPKGQKSWVVKINSSQEQ